MGRAHFRGNVVRQPAWWTLLLALVVSVQAAGPAAVAAHTLQARPVPGNGDSGDAAISADGRFVAFASEASNIVRGDANGVFDVFVRDRVAGTTERVSVGRAGAEADARTGLTDISADGRFVVLWSEAANLVAGDTNREPDVFVRDRLAGATERVSVGSDGAQADGGSHHGAITPDGRFVAFASQASSLAPGDTDGRSAFDVFVRDRASGRTELVGDGWMPAISADGRFVAFEREGSILVHDRAQGTTELVSVGLDGAPANGPSAVPTLSADGRVLAFVSDASNLVIGDTNGPGRRGADVFVRDLAAGTTVRVSVGSDGAQADGSGSNPTISADGRVVAFTSFAPNVAGSPTGAVVVHEVANGRTDVVSVSADGRPRTSYTGSGPVSADGGVVAFFSGEADLVPGDTNDADDVFVRDRRTARTELVSVARARALAAGAVRSRPKQPRAGGKLTVSLRVTLDGGEPVANARVTCAARVRGRALAPAARGFARSTAGCVWRIPRTAGGAVVRGSISAATSAGKVTKAFAVRVR